MGMQVEQIDGVTRVIIESASKRIVIDDPEVAVVKVQGQTVYQVGGGTAREEGPAGAPSQDDAKLVASQAGVSVEEDDRVAGSAATLSRDLVSVFEQWVGDYRLFESV